LHDEPPGAEAGERRRAKQRLRIGRRPIQACRDDRAVRRAKSGDANGIANSYRLQRLHRQARPHARGPGQAHAMPHYMESIGLSVNRGDGPDGGIDDADGDGTCL
jgi:hypothetical protein